MHPNAGTESVKWTGEGIDNATSAITDVLLTEEGVNSYSVIIATGDNSECRDELLFTLIGRVPLRVPNAFSPNGDGVNDKWVVPGMTTFTDANVKVFNRWGNKIFEIFGGYSEADAWDGGNYPVGTYYFIINVNDDAHSEPITGALTITK